MSRLAVVACWLAVAVRVVLVLGLIAISIAFATHPAGTWNWRTWDWMYDIVLGVFILPMLVYIALAFTLRCPSCRRCFLVERGKKHPASRKMDIWVTGAPLCAAFSASANSRWRKVAPSSRIRRSPSASAAELEAQQARQELAHFSRVSTIGELAASLAHELNQPLTGALANARAALRLLEATPPDLVEVRSTLSDIVDDNKRAAEVIRRLRGLLRKGEVQLSVLDLNGLIRDVAKLLSSDAIIRNIAVRLELDPNPLFVSGDAVQLQQVVLNLLLNAMEAMAEGPADGRMITVRTESTEAETVHVSVQDAGPGLGEGTQDLIFEPFYTTKPSGVGMGLAISKSIIEPHGGRIWATDNATAGAIFHFWLPLAARRSRLSTTE